MSISRKNSADRVDGASGAIVEAAAVTFGYEETHVLKGVELAISGGERLALLGANGSGKSTLLRMLAGAFKPDTGEVRLDGAVYEYSRRGRNTVRRSVQMVMQDPDEQIFAASVFADVSFGPVNMGLENEEVERRVREALVTAEIADALQHILALVVDVFGLAHPVSILPDAVALSVGGRSDRFTNACSPPHPFGRSTWPAAKITAGPVRTA